MVARGDRGTREPLDKWPPTSLRPGGAGEAWGYRLVFFPKRSYHSLLSLFQTGRRVEVTEIMADRAARRLALVAVMEVGCQEMDKACEGSENRITQR